MTFRFSVIDKINILISDYNILVQEILHKYDKYESNLCDYESYLDKIHELQLRNNIDRFNNIISEILKNLLNTMIIYQIHKTSLNLCTIKKWVLCRNN
jgi:hypothetical protein